MVTMAIIKVVFVSVFFFNENGLQNAIEQKLHCGFREIMNLVVVFSCVRVRVCRSSKIVLIFFSSEYMFLLLDI